MTPDLPSLGKRVEASGGGVAAKAGGYLGTLRLSGRREKTSKPEPRKPPSPRRVHLQKIPQS